MSKSSKSKPKSPGKAHREGLSIMDLMELFPSEQAATQWFESNVWADGRYCGKCGSVKTKEVPNAKPMPYWCTDCRSYFSVRTGTPIARSNVPLRKWAIAIYLCLTNLKSVSSLKLHRDIGVSQKTAWFMLHRIREAWSYEAEADHVDGMYNLYNGPVEVDETYVGGKRKNMHKSKRSKMKGRGSAGKTAVVGVKDRNTNKVRAKVVEKTDAESLQGFISEHTNKKSKVYTDDASVYQNLPYSHESVKHSVGEYVKDQAHTNGIESFWSMFKRAHKGTFHKISPKHLNRYVQEFTSKHNMREDDTLKQMQDTVCRLVGRNLLYRDLIADNGLSSTARSKLS